MVYDKPTTYQTNSMNKSTYLINFKKHKPVHAYIEPPMAAAAGAPPVNKMTEEEKEAKIQNF